MNNVQQMRDGCGVPRVHVDPQEGGTRGAHLAVRGGLCAPNAPLQRLLLHSWARARGWPRSGSGGYLGALRAPVSARRRSGGYPLTHPAEMASVSDVGGRGPGVDAVEPEMVPSLAKKASELRARTRRR